VDILLVNWQDLENPQAGGAELHLFEIFSRLASRGHRIRLVCSGWTGAACRVELSGIDVTRVGGRLGFALLARGAVRAALRARRPDIVVEDVNKLPLMLPTLSRLPFCAIVPHLFGTTAFEEVNWPMAATVWLSERPLARVYRRAGFHAISESTRDDLVARGVRPGAIRVIHPGVDAERLRPGPPGSRAPAPQFVYVGRLRRYKGVDVALRALALARATRPDLTLEVAGTGAHRPALEQLARELGVADAAHFRGFVSDADKAALFRRAWANLFPSPKEGWGITIVEAGACGTPSLASDSPGLRDSVQHGRTGFLVPHGDARALADRMLELAGDRSLVERLGAAARRFAEVHSWERSADETEAHLHEIISLSGKR
jgi:glycosyltransferase involved in cell wall biosynthesis